MNKHLFFSALLLISLFLCIPIQAGTTKKVINIEMAMRAWQERTLATTGYQAFWDPNKAGMEPSEFPDDGFYGKDLEDPDFCASLVGTLYYYVVRQNGFIHLPCGKTDWSEIFLSRAAQRQW